MQNDSTQPLALIPKPSTTSTSNPSLSTAIEIQNCTYFADISLVQSILGIDFGEPTGAPTARNPEPRDRPVRTQQRLPANVKIFIVICNASGKTPYNVTEAVQELFGYKISSSQVERYDPTKANGQTLRQEYKELYIQVKRERAEALKNIGIANQDIRLALLNDLCMRAVEVNNIRLAAQILTQTAKEVGGFFNKSTPTTTDPKGQS